MSKTMTTHPKLVTVGSLMDVASMKELSQAMLVKIHRGKWECQFTVHFHGRKKPCAMLFCVGSIKGYVCAPIAYTEGVLHTQKRRVVTRHKTYECDDTWKQA